MDNHALASRREPILNAPSTVVALIVAMVAAHVLRLYANVSIERFSLTRANLDAGNWTGVVSYQFVHASWAHLMMNGAFILAFGTPVGRYLGGGLKGGAAFFGFFLICGATAALAYAGEANLGREGWAIVGASGAASGLMGAAMRLYEGKGRLGSMTGRLVIGMTMAWILANGLLGLSNLTPGAQGMPVAWQAHIFGYLAGLALIGLFGRLVGAPKAVVTHE